MPLFPASLLLAPLVLGQSLTPAVATSPHQVTVGWQSPFPGTTEVHYGQSATLLDRASTSPVLAAGTAHSRTLRNLSPGTTYFYKARTTGASSVAESQVLSFTTAAVPLRYAFRRDVNEVWALAWHGDELVAGGTFGDRRDVVGSGIVVTDELGSGTLLSPDFPEVAGAIFASALDAQGRLYLGGRFRSVGGLPRRGLARLLPDQGVDPTFVVPVEGDVLALHVAGDTLYLGGGFRRVGTQPRGNAAAVDLTTGSVTAWRPTTNGEVSGIASYGGTVFLGGEFTAVNGTGGPTGLAAVDAAGQLVAWSGPTVNSGVSSVGVFGTTLVVTGDFTSPRNAVMLLNATNGALVTSFAPGAFRYADGSSARALTATLVGATLYVGGSFDQVGGAAQRGLAALDATTGSLLGGRSVGGTVEFLTPLGGGRLLAVGRHLFNGASPANAVVIEPSGNLRTWNPWLGGAAMTGRPFGGGIFLGGSFASGGGVFPQVGRTVTFDTRTQAAVPRNWSVAGTWVSSLAVWGNQLVVAGAFPKAQGPGGVEVSRANLATYDLTTGNLAAFDPGANAPVRALLVDQGRLYLGGEFSSLGGQPRAGLAAIEADGGVASFDPVAPDDAVYTLARVGPYLAAGGTFTRVGTAARSGVALFDPLTAALSPHAPTFTSASPFSVYGLAADGNVLYAAGDFTGPYPALAAYRLDTLQVGPVTRIDDTYTLFGVAADARTVWAGAYSSGWATSSLLRRIDPADGGQQDQGLGDPGYEGSVVALAWDCAQGRLAVGGNFIAVDDVAAGGLTVLEGLPCARTLPDGGLAITDAGQGTTDAGASTDAGPSDAGPSSDAGAADAGLVAPQLVARLEPTVERAPPGTSLRLVADVTGLGAPGKVRLELDGLAARDGVSERDLTADGAVEFPLRVTAAPNARARALVFLESLTGNIGPVELSVSVEAKAVVVPCGCQSSGLGLWALTALLLALHGRRRR